MSELKIYRNGQGEPVRVEVHAGAIRDLLARIGVVFERWKPRRPLPTEAEQDEIIEAYREEIDRLMQSYGFRSVDVVRVAPSDPNSGTARRRYLHEHVHQEDEVRFLADGQATFYFNHDGDVYSVHCVAGDLITVPARMPHWFDMGEQPDFTMIRLFTRKGGPGSVFTGSDISTRFPGLGR
ncbi:MAG TPA: cupin [Gammaproteobacteria bacterium]|nr:cupin [Gammaproteobacteria bacterium]